MHGQGSQRLTLGLQGGEDAVRSGERGREGSQKPWGGREAGCGQGDQLRGPSAPGMLLMVGAEPACPCLRPRREKRVSWEIRLGI